MGVLLLDGEALESCFSSEIPLPDGAAQSGPLRIESRFATRWV